jgi:hypothetical protein
MARWPFPRSRSSESPSHPTSASEASDPRRWTEAYEAVRAHELMLNEATSALERGRLTPLLTLNGGAIVAFLTLLGALSRQGARTDVELVAAGIAIGLWAIGLFMAAVAAWLATRHQAEVNRGHRVMRERVEAEVVDQPVPKIIKPPDDPDRKRRFLRCIRERKAVDPRRDAGRRAARYGKLLTAAWFVSTVLFLAGAGVAAWAVVVAPARSGKVRLLLTAKASERLMSTCALGYDHDLVAEARLADLDRATVTVTAAKGVEIRLSAKDILATRKLPESAPLTTCSGSR